MLRQKLKISHHSHSGRLRPHEYTSYPMLFGLLLWVGMLLTVGSASALHPPPQQGSVGLSGTVPGKPPATAAVITNPVNGQHFGATPIIISGTCPDNTVVELYKNEIFAGSTMCDTGNFALQIDLLYGQNALVARAYDALNQAAPDSATVNVFYDASGPQTSSLTPLNLSGAQLLLNTDQVYRGVFPDQALSIPMTIIGGTPPYALNIQWGDATSTLVPRGNNLTFNVTHAYKKPGVYQITAQATDGQSRSAFLTTVAIVNGQPAVATTTNGTTTKAAVSKLLILWPLYAIAAAVVVSFWYGERREKRILGGPYLTLHPQG